MSKRRERTDPHRPGVIVPADYEPVLSYDLPSTQDGMPMPSYHVNCQLDRRRQWRDESGKTHVEAGEHDADGTCCVVGLLHIARVPFSPHGGTGKCSICGAAFVEGAVWRHAPSGEHIHVGHICADKYELMADWSKDELERDRQRARTAVEITRLRGEEARRRFLGEHPGLEEALGADHRIVRDIAARFGTFHTLSDKQVALVLKIADEASHPRVDDRPPSNWIGAIGERVVATVTVHRVKLVGDVDSPYGPRYLHVMTDAAGNEVRWFGSTRLQVPVEGRPGALRGVEDGETVRVKMTVKRYEEYQGRKQTIVSRVAHFQERAREAQVVEGGR